MNKEQQLAMSELTEIQQHLLSLAANAFEITTSRLSLESKPGDVPQWDSLGHIVLLEAIREKFGVEPPLERLLEAETLRDLAKIIAESVHGT